MLLKVDLEKAYDRVDWSYLRLVLIQTGIPPLVTHWIMACVTSTCISVLINVAPIGFFSMRRGIRQGCPLSPLLFLLVIEGLSSSITAAKLDGRISGIPISLELTFIHVLFVDDILIGGMDTSIEWKNYYVLFTSFSAATGMKVSLKKSCIYHFRLTAVWIANLKTILPYSFHQLEDGFMYLGYYLKPNDYRSSDWMWLVKKFEWRIAHWTFRLLSIGGRLVLIKAVLTGIPVYWLSLHLIPVSIIYKPRRLTFNFLWSGGDTHRGFVLSSWDSIARPTYSG